MLKKIIMHFGVVLIGTVIIGVNILSALTDKTYTEPNTGMEFVFVKGGCYEMGCGSWMSDCHDNEKPPHEVCVDDFYIGKYEVTQKEYKKVMGKNPSSFVTDDRPVENVTWYKADEFCEKIGGRLPREAEWEYAARSGGKKEKFSGGNNLDSVAWYADNSGKISYPVGTKSPNNLGIYDMSGNVLEWVSDWYSNDYYGESPKSNPEGPSHGIYRVVRGGGWTYTTRGLRTTIRKWYDPGYYEYAIGFRCAGTF